MKFTILTLFPELVRANLSQSILKRALEANVIEVEIINPRDYTKDKHKKVDDTPYGGGPGMLLAVQPFYDAYLSIDKSLNPRTFITTPLGKKYDQKIANELSKEGHIIIICGHYEGFDDRLLKLIKPEEISIGDYVLTGGELPALCIIDSITRLIEGAIGNEESATNDSFQNELLEHPHFTKPREYMGLRVPNVLLNGNHKEIEEWRLLKQLEITKKNRPDLFQKFLDVHSPTLPKNLKKLLNEFLEGKNKYEKEINEFLENAREKYKFNMTWKISYDEIIIQGYDEWFSENVRFLIHDFSKFAETTLNNDYIQVFDSSSKILKRYVFTRCDIKYSDEMEFQK